MRQAWRLAISSLSGRRSRTALLVAAVALSAALVAAVASLMASVNASVRMRLERTVGSADVSIQPAGMGQTLPASVLDTVQAWPEVALAVPRRETSATIRLRADAMAPADDGLWKPTPQRFTTLAQVVGIDPDAEARIRPIELLAGRLPQQPGEVAIDALLAMRLTHAWQALTEADAGATSFLTPDGGRMATPDGYGLATGQAAWEQPAPRLPASTDEPAARVLNDAVGVRLGDSIELVRLFRAPVSVRVVGITAQPPLGGRPQATMTLAALDQALGEADVLTSIDIVLHYPERADAIAAARRAELPEQFVVRTTAKVTSGVEQSIASSQLGMLLVTFMAFLTASFIILTGLLTDATERQRELAILRCIGATRAQLARAQLTVGALIGLVGAGLGAPLGLGIAWALAAAFPEQIPAGLHVPATALWLTVSGALLAGLAGAAYPAWRAARVSPLRALGVRSRAPKARGLALVLCIALALITLHLCIIALPRDGQVVFWGYFTTGLPAMFIGYFLLGTPVAWGVATLLGPALSRALALPPTVLGRAVQSTPARYGMTAGAMMAGLSLMVAIWTQGGAVLRDWLGRFEFADAFVSGLNLPQEAQIALDQLPFVEATCAITLHPVETDAFGVRALQSYTSTFIAFEPEAFFDMTTLTFVEGDEPTARARLVGGGAVMVAREFKVARGLGVGDEFVCRDAEGREHRFDIVAVVTSPGLDIVSKFFNVGEEYTHQSLHAVFGSRADLRERFGSDAIQLIQMELADGTDDATAMATIRRELASMGVGVLDAGSGRMIMAEIFRFVRGTLGAFTAVAVLSMFVASFGVANVIVASIQTRQFEFGVLRAVGAPRGVLLRLVAGEAIIIALTACLLGTLMGLQGSFSGKRMNELLFGIQYSLEPPLGPIALGWGFVVAICLLAAGPAILRLNARRPRELLAATRG